MQENFVFPHKLSRFLILKDYQKDLGQVDMKGVKINKFLLDKKSMNWSLEKHLDLQKRELSITFRLSVWCGIQLHYFAYS